MNRPEHEPTGLICSCGLLDWEHRKRERSNESKHGARKREQGLKTFIGIDGEGVTREDGTHDYVLLTVGHESLIHSKPGRLTWVEIFPFLYEQFLQDEDAAYVGYYLSYDFTQWIRTLTQSRAESLWSTQGLARRQRRKSGGNRTPFPVYVGDEENPWQWEIDLLGMKRMKLRPGTGVSPEHRIENVNRWMYICDVGAFFQQSFLKTLEEFSKSNPDIVTPDEYATIKKGKEKRSIAKLDDEMIKYNLLECELLARIMPLINEGFASREIYLPKHKWFGPGQAAELWMRNINAPTSEQFCHKPRGNPCRYTLEKSSNTVCGRQRSVHVPEWARAIGQATYFGGWFEIFCHGPIPGPSYEYDLNSAYPDQISKLPCLLHGKWERGGSGYPTWEEVEKLSNRTLIAVECSPFGKNPMVGAMLHRTDSGSVVRPQMTNGWFWMHELKAAIKAGLICHINNIKTWVSYEGCDCPPPYAGIRELYEDRLKVGKKTPRGKSNKLVYNSSYGKMAQSVGQPTYANGIYASLITAGCRTRICEAIATHPTKSHDLLMIATDGIYFRSPHPNLDFDDNRLGAWSKEEKSNLSLFMPGLYWDDKARDALRDGKTATLKSRGVPGRDMAKKILQTDELWQKFKPGSKKWPTVELDIAFSMVTIGQALNRGKWELCGTVSTDSKRTITADPRLKREGSYRLSDVIRSSAYFMAPSPGGHLSSQAYSRRFGDELTIQHENTGIETPDGDVHSLIVEQLGLKG